MSAKTCKIRPKIAVRHNPPRISPLLAHPLRSLSSQSLNATASARSADTEHARTRSFHPMLVLSRKIGERIHIGDNITIEIRRVAGNRVTLALDAPRTVRILRGELNQAAREFRDAAEFQCTRRRRDKCWVCDARGLQWPRRSRRSDGAGTLCGDPSPLARDTAIIPDHVAAPSGNDVGPQHTQRFGSSQSQERDPTNAPPIEGSEA